MANPIKYNTGSESRALNKGNWWIGTGDVGKGPTDSTGFWNGYDIPEGGYVVYINKATGGPSVYAPANDAELISLTNQIANTSYTTVNECFTYYAGQTDKVCLNRDYEGVVTDGLVLNLDAGFTPSYPRSGTTWYDVSSDGNNGTLTNGPTFNSDNGGSIVFDGTNDYVLINPKPERLSGIRLGDGTIPWMVNIWIKTTIPGGDSISSAPILTNQSGGPVYCNMGIGSGGVMKYNHYYTSWLTEKGTIVVNSGNWVMLSWVNRDNYTLDMYVNGTFDINVPSRIQGGGNINPVDIIFKSWANSYIEGNIGMLTINKRNNLYIHSDVLQNYNATKGRFL